VTLYVCWGTFRTFGSGHPCGNALHALRGAGHEPEIVRCRGWGALPSWLNRTRGRREVRRLTGSDWVPVLVAADEVVQGTDAIRAWAARQPAA